MAAIVAHHALGLSGRAGGVDDVKRIGGLDRHAVVRLRVLDEGMPVDVASGDQIAPPLLALQHDAMRRLVLRQIDGAVEQRLVFDDAVGLDAAGGGKDQRRLEIVDAGGELVRGEAAEHHRMDGAQPGAGQHRHHRFRHHRHVDNDPVALADTEPGHGAGQGGRRVAHLAIGEALLGAGHGRIVDHRRLLGAAAFDVAVERVPAGVELAADEPAVEGRIAFVEQLRPRLEPVDGLGCLAPETGRIAQRTLVKLAIGALCRHQRSSPRRPVPGRSAHSIDLLQE